MTADAADPAKQRKVFLTAEWRNLVMLNYVVDPQKLLPRVPAGTELDFFEGKTYLSMVGFLFLNTRVAGIPIPFHRNFEEVNLRFYVRRNTSQGTRRGVVFIKEIVPRRAIACVARWVYGENYVALPMRHSPAPSPAEALMDGTTVEYAWRFREHWNRLGAKLLGGPLPSQSGTEAEFIAEHYWGYSRHEHDNAAEYRVEHSSWRVWRAASSWLECDAERLYGQELAPYLAVPPASAFVGEGSPVIVRKAMRISNATRD